MNRITELFCSIFLLAAAATSADAQTTLGDAVSVGEVAVSRDGERVFVAMDIDIRSLQLKSNNDLCLTPYIAAGGDTLRMQPVMIAGRNRYYHHLRNDREAACEAIYRHGRVERIEYRTVVPYGEWMASGRIGIDGVVSGCCDEEAERYGGQLARLDLAPKREPMRFEPSFVYVSPVAERVKTRTVKGSAYIDFPVNRTEIYEDYRRNPEELRKIVATIDLVRNDPDTRITSIRIKGYASPEGPYDNNVRLAKGRTATLKDYVLRQYDLPDEMISTAYEPEDWQGLRRVVEQSDIVSRSGILSLIDSDLSPDAKDARIRRDYPDDYAYLLREVYPALRHSDYEVEYTVRTYTDVDEIRRLLSTAPQKLSLQEMYLAAQELTPGSEEYDEVFAIAVRMFPDDAAANLNAANAAMSLSDMKRAERYLAKAGSSAEATYARGIYAALEGDYMLAGRLFAEARDGGVAEAAGALDMIERIKNENNE